MEKGRPCLRKSDWPAMLIMGTLLVILVGLFLPQGHKQKPFELARDSITGFYKTLSGVEQGMHCDGDATKLFPKPGEFETSTDYFEHLISSGVIDSDLSLFEYKGEVIWCVAEIEEPLAYRTPVIFSSNLPITNLNQAITIEDVSKKPFNTKAIVVVTRAGASYIIKEELITTKSFNPLGESARVLRPRSK